MTILLHQATKIGDTSDCDVFAHDNGIVSVQFTNYAPYIFSSSHLTADQARDIATALLAAVDAVAPAQEIAA